MPGLLRGVARTAVIAGTATAVSNRVSRRQGERWQRDAQADAYEQQQIAAAQQPPPAPPASSSREDMLAWRAEVLGCPDRRRVRGAEGEDPGRLSDQPPGEPLSPVRSGGAGRCLADVSGLLGATLDVEVLPTLVVGQRSREARFGDGREVVEIQCPPPRHSCARGHEPAAVGTEGHRPDRAVVAVEDEPFRT
jgi:hypothetical protein